jgi:hypothetical protein
MIGMVTCFYESLATSSHALGNAPVRPGYNELALHLTIICIYMHGYMSCLTCPSFLILPPTACIQQALKQILMEACVINETYLASVRC